MELTTLCDDSYVAMWFKIRGLTVLGVAGWNLTAKSSRTLSALGNAAVTLRWNERLSNWENRLHRPAPQRPKPNSLCRQANWRPNKIPARLALLAFIKHLQPYQQTNTWARRKPLHLFLTYDQALTDRTLCEMEISQWKDLRMSWSLRIR